MSLFTRRAAGYLQCPDLQPGQIIHVTVWASRWVDWWAIVTNAETRTMWATARVLVSVGERPASSDQVITIHGGLSDVLEIVNNDDDVPDEVWAALATWQLAE